MTTESGNKRFKILMASSKKWDTPGFSTRPSTVFDIHQHNAGHNSVKNISVC